MKIKFVSIGTIHTPYKNTVPYYPDENLEGEFYLELDPEYQQGLFKLETFSHIVVLFYFDRSKKVNLIAHPPHLEGGEVGLFASRSPNRVNHIGLDIVRLIKIEGNLIHTSCMDILDNTPLIDIKPYVPKIDLKPDANNGWLNSVEGMH